MPQAGPNQHALPLPGNHVGYKRFTGRKSTPEEVSDLYAGLKDAHLANFDVLLSGYCPSAALVEQIGLIARERKLQTATTPGSFFWVLDPVMGDNGRIYVAEDTVPAYRSLLKDADLILPNHFEAELLSGVTIKDTASIRQAVTVLHQTHRVPHILITSVRLSSLETNSLDSSTSTSANLSVIGSTATSTHQPRLFRLTVPALPVFFSGTGDMFAALLVARLRQKTSEANLLETEHWRSSDDIPAEELPLAKAAEMVLASMHAVLKDTAEHYEAVERELDDDDGGEVGNEGTGEDAEEEKGVERHLRLTRAAEVRVVQNAGVLREPPELERFRAQALEVQVER